MITIHLNNKMYATVSSLAHAQLMLDCLAEEFPDLEYTEPDYIIFASSIAGSLYGCEEEETPEGPSLPEINPFWMEGKEGQKLTNINGYPQWVDSEYIAPMQISSDTAEKLRQELEKIRKEKEAADQAAFNQAISQGFSNSMFGGFYNNGSTRSAVPITKYPTVSGMPVPVSADVAFSHGGKVDPEEPLELGKMYILDIKTIVREGVFTSFPYNGRHYFEFHSGGMNYILSPPDVYGNLYYPYMDTTRKTQCSHEYVDVGFMHTKMACKYCGQDQDVR